MPDGDYFVDWNADELFIIFYGNDTTNDEILDFVDLLIKVPSYD